VVGDEQLIGELVGNVGKAGLRQRRFGGLVDQVRRVQPLQGSQAGGEVDDVVLTLHQRGQRGRQLGQVQCPAGVEPPHRAAQIRPPVRRLVERRRAGHQAEVHVTAVHREHIVVVADLPKSRNVPDRDTPIASQPGPGYAGTGDCNTVIGYARRH
jgi:hypothetical protein